MKKIIDKRFVYINAALLILGIIAGILFLIFTSSLDKLIVKNEITDFFGLLSDGSVSSISGVFNSFKCNMVYILLVSITSIIYLFSPLILFINFYKGVLIGFLISSVVMTYKIKGVLYGILLIFPHHILMAMVLVLYSSIMLHFSLKLIRGTYKNESINLKTFIKKIGVIFLIGCACSLICSIFEIYVNPLFLKMFI